KVASAAHIAGERAGRRSRHFAVTPTTRAWPTAACRWTIYSRAKCTGWRGFDGGIHQSQRARHNCDTRPDSKISYNRGMNENLSRELLAWLTQAGLAGTPESDIFSVFCDRCVAAGLPLGRAHVAIDTLHPVHEGSLFRWGYPNEPLVYEYGRTSLEGLDVSGAVSLDAQATDVWRRVQDIFDIS